MAPQPFSLRVGHIVKMDQVGYHCQNKGFIYDLYLTQAMTPMYIDFFWKWNQILFNVDYDNLQKCYLTTTSIICIMKNPNFHH